MKISVSTIINQPTDVVWATVSNIKNSANVISGIEKVEVLQEPTQGLIGLKWKETRTLFGKTATETMWITDEEPGKSYDVRAESHGAIYLSKLMVTNLNGHSELTMSFEGIAQTFGAKVLSAIFGRMAKKATQKALQKDLEDIKSHLEQA